VYGTEGFSDCTGKLPPLPFSLSVIAWVHEPDFNAIVRALDLLVVAQQKRPWEYIGTIAVVLTLAVLIWYTIETYKLRKAAQVQTSETAKLFVEAQRQNETSLQLLEETQRQNETALQMLKETQVQSAASIRPILQMVSSVRRDTLVTVEFMYQIRNPGVGPAFSISIEAVRFPKAVYLFENPDTLGTGDQPMSFRSGQQKNRTVRKRLAGTSSLSKATNISRSTS
jgi:hypothetical protein